MFARCQPTDTAVSVSFKLHAALWNPGPNYLSACEEALPVLFFIFFVFFAGATGVWIWLLIKGGNKVELLLPQAQMSPFIFSSLSRARSLPLSLFPPVSLHPLLLLPTPCWTLQVQKIHYMMAVLLVVKTMAMLFESIRYHFIATTGVGHEWSVIYYIFAFLKGTRSFL